MNLVWSVTHSAIMPLSAVNIIRQDIVPAGMTSHEHTIPNYTCISWRWLLRNRGAAYLSLADVELWLLRPVGCQTLQLGKSLLKREGEREREKRREVTHENTSTSFS